MLCCYMHLGHKMMDQRINFVVYVKVLLSEPTNFPLSVSPSKKMGDCMNQNEISPGL